MKKILITGAAGTIGKKVIKYLLSEGKYELILVDLKSRLNSHTFRKYKKRALISYTDINDISSLEDYVKESDYIIHLASCDPTFSDLNPNLSYTVNFRGTENIVRLINFYNPKCHLFYASSSSVYGKQNTDTVSVSTKIDETTLSPFSKAKYDSEKIIKEKLNNYTIFRIPIVLCNPYKDKFVYTYSANAKFEVITADDVAYMFVRAILKTDEINKKVFNVGGGEHSITTGKELNNEMLKTFGYPPKYMRNRILYDKTFNTYIFKDSDKLDEILSYRNDSMASYFMRVRRGKKKYHFRKLLAKPFIKKNK